MNSKVFNRKAIDKRRIDRFISNIAIENIL